MTDRDEQETLVHDAKLIQSYVRDKYFVSTAIRWSSTDYPSMYYECFAWEWDAKDKERGKWVVEEACGNSIDAAFALHDKVCRELAAKCSPPYVSSPDEAERYFRKEEA